MQAETPPHISSPVILVTGGAGFIGSHTCVELIDAGYRVVVVDDLSNGHRQALDAVKFLTGVGPVLEEVDITDHQAMRGVFARHSIDAIIHFAARKAVGESTEIPFAYFHTNVGGTTTLLAAASDAGVHRVIFSSSCSIYGEASVAPLDEASSPAPTNPYAWTKLVGEQMLEQACRYDDRIRAISLRYFNPIGAHPSGLLGEDPRGVPRNLVPYLAQVAEGRRDHLVIFGDDYPTPDGTAIRDYIHVSDVARGHVTALEHLNDVPGMQLFNLGTGRGTSVLELHSAFEEACGRPIPYVISQRRDGDVSTLVARIDAVQQAWGWSPKFDLAEMCADAWRFQQTNPGGYR